MTSANNDQDLLPEQTEGFKVGEKKTMDEYHKLGTFFFAFMLHQIVSQLPQLSTCLPVFQQCLLPL